MEKNWKIILLTIKFESKLVYGDDEKYIKTKIKTYGDSNFHSKKIPSSMQVFINNNARFCYWSKEKVLSSNTFGRM